MYFLTGSGRVSWHRSHTMLLLDLVKDNYELLRNSTLKKQSLWNRIADKINHKVSIGSNTNLNAFLKTLVAQEFFSVS